MRDGLEYVADDPELLDGLEYELEAEDPELLEGLEYDELEDEDAEEGEKAEAEDAPEPGQTLHQKTGLQVGSH